MNKRASQASIEDRRKLAGWIAQSPVARTNAEGDVARCERPIAFGKEMVLAILNGRKTQTRRLIRTDRDGRPFPPPGEVGDVLWVRERFASWIDPTGGERFLYAADGPPPNRHAVHWRMSIHMPRRASRIAVRITAVRTERLQAISDRDVLAEGYPDNHLCDPRAWFTDLWDYLSPDGSKWSDNPEVWVLNFTPLQLPPPATRP